MIDRNELRAALIEETVVEWGKRGPFALDAVKIRAHAAYHVDAMLPRIVKALGRVGVEVGGDA